MASHRRTLTAAIAAAAASLSLYPIFAGSAWFFAGLGSIIVVALAGTLTRLRWLPVWVTLAGGVAALLLYLNLVFSNSRSLFHLLPTPASVAALWDLAGRGFAEAAKYAPPVPELRGMLLLAAAGIGIAALLTDFIAVRLESAALAGLPLLLLFTEPFTLSLSRGFLGTTVAFAIGVAGYLGLLSSEGRDRIREWEQPDPSAFRAPDTRALAAAGRRVGFASVVLALFLPLVIPGLHVTRLFGGQPGIGGNGESGGGSAAAGFPDLNTQLSQQLRTTTASNVLVYTSNATQPDYLQLYVLGQLTDSGWQVSGQPLQTTAVSPKMPPPPGLTDKGSSTAVATSVTIASTIGQDQLGALPVPYPATSVRLKGTGASVQAERSTLMVLAPGATLARLSYSVTSLEVSPPAQLLANAPPPPADVRQYLQVPASYDSLRALAESVARGAKNPFTAAVDLQDWLANGDFTYTLDAPSVVNARGLENFLKVTKHGYCQQFAFAMAVFARLLGIPARVVYGFTSGTPQGNDEWLVTTHDAHAWPQLYFRGFGWLRFEPTPPGSGAGQGTAYAPAYTLPGPGASLPGSRQTTLPATSSGASGAPGQLSQQAIRQELRLGLGTAGAGKSARAARTGAGTLNPWQVLGFVVAGLAVLAVTAPWCARQLIRRRRWHRHQARAARRAGSGRGAGPGTGRDAAWAHAAWRELRDDLVDYGAACLPSESPRAVAERVGTSLELAGPARAALGRIALAEERARYAARPADGSGLHRDSAAVRRGIAAAVPRLTRWRARVLPSSVLGPALGTVLQAADIFGRLNLEWLGRLRVRRA